MQLGCNAGEDEYSSELNRGSKECNLMLSYFYIDDSIAGTTSSQIIHDTVADFTSQWQVTSKILDVSKSMRM